MTRRTKRQASAACTAAPYPRYYTATFIQINDEIAGMAVETKLATQYSRGLDLD